MSAARLAALAGALTIPCALASAPAAARSACGLGPYAYAGLQTLAPVHGVAAGIAALAPPAVRYGHVGGWVGVGGPGLGPSRTDAWLQAGLSGFPREGGSRLYYEVAAPGRKPRYVEVAARVEPGERYRVAVLEMAKRPSWWRVWVDDRPVSAPLFLPGSHGRWPAQVVAESWNGGTGACNRFAYRFAAVELASRPGGAWTALGRGALLFSDPGYRVRRPDPRTLLASSLP